MTDPAATPRLIRRYANRKLYDVQTSAYVALEDLAALVRAGEELRVVDTSTGDDITAQTLTQVILDEGKRGSSLLPTDLLHAALRRGGRALDAGRDVVGGAVGTAVGSLRHGVDGLVHQSFGRLARVLPTPRADELDAMRQQLAQMERTVAALVARQNASPSAGPTTDLNAQHDSGPAAPGPAAADAAPTLSPEDPSR